MQARADAVRATRERIVAATVEVFWERPTDQIALEEVGRRAGVSKQTVLRHFGTKSELLATAAAHALEETRAERDDVAPGDVGTAVRALVAHYERIGDGVLRLLAAEGGSPSLREIADRGRDYHADWCERLFPAALAGHRGADRDRRLAQLVAVTDVYVWKLLRHDRGLSRPQTELAIRELLEPLTGGAR